MAKKKPKKKKTVESLRHSDDKRTNIPTAELESVVSGEDKSPIRVAIERRDPDLDPQLVWRGKDTSDELVVGAPPLYIQEKIHPKVLIDDLLTKTERQEDDEAHPLFANLHDDFNGLPENARSTEFYQHEANWTNRMILGDSLQVMASLAEREGLRGKVQCIYFDPPYGIKFNSNFQWSTTSRDVKDGKSDHITREPEQVKAFRDTWRDGIHSYLTYLRDRLTVARDLLSESGSIFVQIGDENVHRLRGILDEIFGTENFCGQITYVKTTSATSSLLPTTTDFLLWYAKAKQQVKYRQLFKVKSIRGDGSSKYRYVRHPDGSSRTITKEEVETGEVATERARVFRLSGITSQSRSSTSFPVEFHGRVFTRSSGSWKTNEDGFRRLTAASRLHASANSLNYVRYIDDFPAYSITDVWDDIGGIQSRADPKVYVVQTAKAAVERCLLMASDPGDLVLDPTCGSGTAATVAEQWGRRWITVDTSRVALALARSRIMGARYPFYLLADSIAGKQKEAELTRREVSTASVNSNIRHGFVTERVPHIMLSSIARNSRRPSCDRSVVLTPFQDQFFGKLRSFRG